MFTPVSFQTQTRLSRSVVGLKPPPSSFQNRFASVSDHVAFSSGALSRPLPFLKQAFQDAGVKMDETAQLERRSGFLAAYQSLLQGIDAAFRDDTALKADYDKRYNPSATPPVDVSTPAPAPETLETTAPKRRGRKKKLPDPPTSQMTAETVSIKTVQNLQAMGRSNATIDQAYEQLKALTSPQAEFYPTPDIQLPDNPSYRDLTSALGQQSGSEITFNNIVDRFGKDISGFPDQLLKDLLPNQTERAFWFVRDGWGAPDRQKVLLGTVESKLRNNATVRALRDVVVRT